LSANLEKLGGHRQWVRVRDGVPDPDFPHLPLQGCIGWVVTVDQTGPEPLLLISWTEQTFRYGQFSWAEADVDEDLNLEEIWLPVSAVELIDITKQYPPPAVFGMSRQERELNPRLMRLFSMLVVMLSALLGGLLAVNEDWLRNCLMGGLGVGVLLSLLATLISSEARPVSATFAFFVGAALGVAGALLWPVLLLGIVPGAICGSLLATVLSLVGVTSLRGPILPLCGAYLASTGLLFIRDSENAGYGYLIGGGIATVFVVGLLLLFPSLFFIRPAPKIVTEIRENPEKSDPNGPTS
jgi:hypothetical protein